MLSRNQIDHIAGDAVLLRQTLIDQHIPETTADAWVAQSMMALVMNETDPPEPRPLVFGGRLPGEEIVPADMVRDMGRTGGKSNVIADRGITWPTAEQEEGKQAQLAAESARWGNVNPAADREGITPAVLEELAYEPQAGRDIRLVATPGQPGEEARREARKWVRDNVPEAGVIEATTYAGRLARGDTVYLVAYVLKAAEGYPRHPVQETEERKN